MAGKRKSMTTTVTPTDPAVWSIRITVETGTVNYRRLRDGVWWHFEDGKTYDVPEDIARQAIHAGWAVKV